MSRFSNPPGDAATAAASYSQALIDLLAGSDPVGVMSETPEALRLLTAGLEVEELRRPECEGKWSIAQVLQHLADTELVVATRIRFPVAQDEPAIVGFDQEAWVSRLWKGDEPIEEIVIQFETLRLINLRYLARLSAEEWERAGIHAERGRETVRRVVALAGGHDIAHCNQIRRIRETLVS